jgi:hypothetical protein
MQFYTYAHYKPNGEIFYIGKGQHGRAFRSHGRNPHWKSIVQKHGSFKVEILARWKLESEAHEHEVFLIDTFKKMDVNLANITLGGEGVSGLLHCGETKTILRDKSLSNGSVERCKAMAVDPIMIEKRRASATGKKRTDESKTKMAEAKKYKSRPIEVCGKPFESISALAKFLGMYKTTIRRWIDDGQIEKVEEAYRANVS